MLPKDGITVLDSTIPENSIHILPSLREYLGFELVNQTGAHVFIEVEFGPSPTQVKKMTLRMVGDESDKR
jgi:hypothetical protein